MKSRRFRVESCDGSLERDDSLDVSSTPVLENPDHQTKWYYKYFLGKFHQNYVGQDTEKNTYVLSVLKEKSFGKTLYRTILWMKDGPKRLCISGGKDDALPAKQILAHFGQADKIEKLPREISHPGIQKDLLSLEKQEGAMNFKFGVIYAKAGQVLDDELFSNVEGSPDFDRFLDLLGQRIRLKGWIKYKGGLDVNKDQTGQYSVFTEFEEHEIMFHVSTLLPYTEDDKQQIERKRHIGNDIVNVIFLDGTPEEMIQFKPVFIKSNFTHIYVVVCFEKESESYCMSVFSEKSVPLFGPSLPNPAIFAQHQDFRRFLLVKMINGEKATYNTNVFSSKRERTYEMLLQDMYDQYILAPMDDTKGSMGGYSGTGDTTATQMIGTSGFRKKEIDTKMDKFVKVGQTLKLESALKGEISSSVVAPRPSKSLWEPLCIFPNFEHDVICGDSWMNSNLLLGTTDGVFLIVHNRPPVLLFDRSLGTVAQINVIEPYGILLFRTERGQQRGDEGSTRIYVFRLSDLEKEFLLEDDFLNNEDLNLPTWTPKSKSELKENGIECSKGCSVYSVSRKESSRSSGLKVAFAVGKKVMVMRWIHQEEWISMNNDTAEGFVVESELHATEAPVISLTLLEPSPGAQANANGGEHEDNGGILVGTRHHFEVLRPNGATPSKLLAFAHGSDGAVSAVEVHNHIYQLSNNGNRIQEDEDQELEVLLTYNCCSHLQKIPSLSSSSPPGGGKSSSTSQITVDWSFIPSHVVFVFPYILALTTDTIEFRSAVNGALLQTIHLPDLALISFKDDLYFSSSRQPTSAHKNHKPIYNSSLGRSRRFIYKIPWVLLMGQQPQLPGGGTGVCIGGTGGVGGGGGGVGGGAGSFAQGKSGTARLRNRTSSFGNQTRAHKGNSSPNVAKTPQ
ncbi:GTPase-activating Rap/Ran-GAP domain-like protein 3 isoform X1 [Tigriopus californicus]|nr:GTPase-activating Rap/Ran-GAP domain-like protein 3 isoform X1 [Tigriopus californicus]